MIARARLGLMALALSFPLQVAGQAGPGASSEQHRLVEVRQKQVALREARAALGRSEELGKQGLLSHAALAEARARLETAQLAYQQALLDLLSVDARLSVQEAVKYRDASGRRYVRLTVANATPTFDDAQFTLLNNFEGEDPLPPELRHRTLRDIMLSLHEAAPAGPGTASAGTVAIGLPYEVHVPRLEYGTRRTYVFQLLRDVDQITVVSSHGRERQEIGVQLAQAATTQVVTVSATQISQEADLGTSAVYELRLERSSVDVRSFRLRVLNLPPEISYSFVAAESEARLSQISFPAGVTQQQIRLRLFLPESPSARVRLDDPLRFWPIAYTNELAGALETARAFAEPEIRASRAGAVELAVVPRGVGRLTLGAASLYAEVPRGEAVTARLRLRNLGTLRLDNVRVEAEYPNNWRVTLSPEIVSDLGLNAERMVELRVEPPAEVLAGDYEVRLKTSALAHNRPVPAEDKVFRVSLTTPLRLVGTMGLMGLLVVAVVGVVAIGVRSVRR